MSPNGSIPLSMSSKSMTLSMLPKATKAQSPSFTYPIAHLGSYHRSQMLQNYRFNLIEQHSYYPRSNWRS